MSNKRKPSKNVLEKFLSTPFRVLPAFFIHFTFLKMESRKTMNEFPKTVCQAVADFSRGIRVREVTEQHGDELSPAGETFGVSLGLLFCGKYSIYPSQEGIFNILFGTRVIKTEIRLQACNVAYYGKYL